MDEVYTRIERPNIVAVMSDEDERLAAMLEQIDRGYLDLCTAPSTDFPQLISLAEQARDAIDAFLTACREAR